MNHVNTNEALAKVVSISGFIESFAKDMAKTKIDVMPITMIGHDDSIFSMIDEESAYHDDDHDDSLSEGHCCSGCMECLGLSWLDFM